MQTQGEQSVNLMAAKLLSDEALEQMTKEVAGRHQRGLPAPGLAIIQLTEHPEVVGNIQTVARQCEQVGFSFRRYEMLADVREIAILQLIDDLNADPEIHGISLKGGYADKALIQRLASRIIPEKDIEGLHHDNLGRLATGCPEMEPVAVEACRTLMNFHNIDRAEKHAVIVGDDISLTRPLALSLYNEGASVSTCSDAQAAQALMGHADILVTALDQPGHISSGWLSKDTIVFDVGVNQINPQTTTGDLDRVASEKVSAYISRDSGLDHMLASFLIQNTMYACQGMEGHYLSQ